MKKLQYRHRDLLLESCKSIPTGGKVRNTNAILWGEVSTHAYRLHEGAIIDIDLDTFLDVPNGGTVTHEEHNAITLPPGTYRVTRQREWDPYEQAARAVQD